FYRAAAGGEESDQVVATAVGGTKEVVWRSARFGGSLEEVTLLGFGRGAELARSETVRFADGNVAVNARNYPADQMWSLYCLSSSPEPSQALELEVFALRSETPPPGDPDPYDFIQRGLVATGRQLALELEWGGLQLDGVRLVAAVRMEVLLDEALNQLRNDQSLIRDHGYLIVELERAGRDLITGTVQAIGNRFRQSAS